MTARKTTTLPLLALCLTLAAAAPGCNIGMDSSQQEPTPTPPAGGNQRAQQQQQQQPAQQPPASLAGNTDPGSSPQPAQDRAARLRPQVEELKAAQNEAAKAAAELVDAKKKVEPSEEEVNDLRAKAQKMEQQTRDSGKDPTDPAQSPNTVEARKKADDAQRKFDAAIALAQNKNNRAAARVSDALNSLLAAASDSRGETPPVVGAAAVLGWEFYTLSGLSLLLLLATAALSYFSWSELRAMRRHAELRAQERMLQQQADAAQQLTNRRNAAQGAAGEATATTLDDLKAAINRARDAVLTKFEESVEAARSSYAAAQAAAAAAAQAQAAPPAPREDKISFPISVTDFVRRIGDRAEVVKRDALNNMLVSDPDGKGPLMLVQTGQLPDGAALVPRVSYLETGDDYHYNYGKFFECANPSSGDVWILRPGTVERAEGGWRLRDKGALEIKK